MSGGDSGGGSNSSRPLTAAERSELFDAAQSKMGAYMPKASDYQGFTVIDPSADRGRGNGGYGGYSNVAPIKLRDTVSDYDAAYKSAANQSQNTMLSFLSDYFKQRDAAETQRAASQNYGG